MKASHQVGKAGVMEGVHRGGCGHPLHQPGPNDLCDELDAADEQLVDQVYCVIPLPRCRGGGAVKRGGRRWRAALG